MEDGAEISVLVAVIYPTIGQLIPNRNAYGIKKFEFQPGCISVYGYISSASAPMPEFLVAQW